MLTPIVHTGNCLDHMLGVIEPHSVHCIVSSPPYWGLRDYGIPGTLWGDGWIGVYGNEPSISQYIAHTLELFDAMRRVLRPDGVIWWNIGDCYITGAGKANSPGGGSRGENWAGEKCQPNRMPQAVAAGNKLLMPHRVAIALQDAGWCIRQDNIWSKPAPMPESISGWHWTRCRVKVAKGVNADVIAPGSFKGTATQNGKANRHCIGGVWLGGAEFIDCPGCPKCEANGGYVLRRGKWRNTTGHEYIFQITQGQDYFCDATAAAEATTGNAHSRGHGRNPKTGTHGTGQVRQNGSFSGAVNEIVSTRNPRSVWHFAAESFKGAHFATFPTELPYRCIKASTSPAGCCPHCGSQWAPVTAKVRRPTRPGETTKLPGRNSRAFVDRDAKHDNEYKTDRYEMTVGNRDPQRHVTETVVLEYRQTCGCPAHSPIPATVYDPFGGSLTTAAVAAHMGRRAITSEINPTYIGLGDIRLSRRPKAIADRDPKKPRKPRKKKHQRRQLLLIEAEG